MAIVKVQSNARCLVLFNERELAQYKIEARAVKYNRKVFVNFALPYMKWKGHDRRCAEDVIEALKLVGKWQAGLQEKQTGFNAHAHNPTIFRDNGLTDQKVRFPVFANHSEPHVQYIRDADGYGEWNVMGFYFNDDLPSVRAYVAALSALVDKVFEELR